MNMTKLLLSLFLSVSVAHGAAITGGFPVGVPVSPSSVSIGTAGAVDATFLGAVGGFPGVWMGGNTTTPAASNASMQVLSTTTVVNGATALSLRIAGSAIASGSSTAFTIAGSGIVLSSFIQALQQVTDGGTPTNNSARIYSKDVSGTAEVFVKDEGGTETQISPHSTTSPAPAEVDAESSATLPIVLHHSNEYLGQEEWLHLSALAKEVERLSGKQFVFSKAMPAGRVKDWNAEQAKQAQSRTKELAGWQARKAAAEKAGEVFAEDKPSNFTPKAKPAFLQKKK